MLNALKQGKEIVIVSADPDANSAIFWLNSDDIICSFNTVFGIIVRPDLTLDRLQEHLENMRTEHAYIYVRG